MDEELDLSHNINRATDTSGQQEYDYSEILR